MKRRTLKKRRARLLADERKRWRRSRDASWGSLVSFNPDAFKGFTDWMDKLNDELLLRLSQMMLPASLCR